MQVRAISLSFLLAFAATSAAAADKPVPNSLLPPGIRSISVTLTKVKPTKKREPSQKAFLRSLSEPIGGDATGRLE